jgi:hypothetical protein
MNEFFAENLFAMNLGKQSPNLASHDPSNITVKYIDSAFYNNPINNVTV